jgi:hypothetical protein
MVAVSVTALPNVEGLPELRRTMDEVLERIATVWTTFGAAVYPALPA